VNGPLTLIIADDHPLFRKGLVEVLRDEPGIRIVAEAGDGAAALELIERTRPDLALLDIAMPKLSGLDVARLAAERGLTARIVLLTMHDEPEILARAVELGVAGYVVKESAASELLACVHYVAAGKMYVSPALSHEALRKARAAMPPAESTEGLATLTPVERRVMGLIAQHKTTPQIATVLGIRPKTVDNHRSNICKKLGVTGPNALIRFALEHKQQLA
jgi:DNA-binding NarL/FixJ family response regulator